MYLPPDTAHAAGWRDEVRATDFVAGFFVPDDFLEVILQVGVRGAAAKAGAEVVFFDAEEAGADFAIGG